MKSILFALALALNCANLAFGRCAPQAFYMTMHNTPVMVYATISDCKADKKTGLTTATLQSMSLHNSYNVATLLKPLIALLQHIKLIQVYLS